MLIVSAFILTPISLVIAFMLLSAPTFVPGAEVSFVSTEMINGSTSGMRIEKFNASTMPPHPFAIQSGMNMSPGRVLVMPDNGSHDFVYSPTGPPKFMISGGPYMHQVLDISTVIIIFTVTSIVLSSMFLFIGIKEFMFFSKWNKKFARFMSLKDKVVKELVGT
jgi:hypothetical protein